MNIKSQIWNQISQPRDATSSIKIKRSQYDQLQYELRCSFYTFWQQAFKSKLDQSRHYRSSEEIQTILCVHYLHCLMPQGNSGITFQH